MSIVGWGAIIILALICYFQYLHIKVLELQVSEILKSVEDCIVILNKIIKIFNGE